ncbi:LytTR family DNA-binding domain-containing protein [uncultured Caulobacter sp.]|uniref:LytTR family DNA-binding domain-containing protein n=1 Tax=uncultured Caulobacter sp. TaxID=158749 RepID=UPI00262D381F|nr:LytTR family DNA-binding domain-containing protein [uncultured Caulobacter sp.]
MTAARTMPPLLGTAREWAIDLAVAVGIGVLLGLMGPFGSFYNDGMGVRIAYWVGSTVTGMAVIGGLARLGFVLAWRRGWPLWTVLLPVALVGSVAQGAPLRLVAVALWPQIDRLVSPLAWYAQCVAITTPIVLVYYFVRVRPLARARASEGVVPVTAAAPTIDPGAVLYLRMEDHYVRVRTEHGSRLEMGPLARVTTGLAGVEGLQTHRSWWVARRAIVGVERDGRNLRLRLVDGQTAPVSRASVAKLRAAGWLAEENPA